MDIPPTNPPNPLSCFACHYNNPNMYPTRDTVVTTLIGFMISHHFGTVDLVHDALCLDHKAMVTAVIYEEHNAKS